MPNRFRDDHRNFPSTKFGTCTQRFSGKILGVENAPLDKEILALHWLTPAELKQKAPMHRSPLVQQCLDDYRAGNNFPLEVLSKSYG